MHKPPWLLLMIVISCNFVRLAVEIVVQKENDQVEHLAGVAMLKPVHVSCRSMESFSGR
jgi:hypothetical protein